MSPVFDSNTKTYRATTSNNSNKITATATNEGTEISITVNGSPLANGTSATWQIGQNDVLIKVGSTTYKVVVEK